MQETLYKTADAGDTLSDSGYRSISIRQRMPASAVIERLAGVQKSLYHTADAGVSLSDSGCRSLSIA